MARVSQNGKLTFGFRNVNGRAFKVKITQSSRARFVDKFTLPTLRQEIVSIMNKHGKRAEMLAKTPGWSPFAIGTLTDSIKWQSAKRSGFTGLVIGNLTVGVPYGRRQEFSPTQPRRLYLHRALRRAEVAMAAELRNKRVMGDIILGKRKVVGGGVANPANFKG